jgi:hypothetical protein
MPSKPAIGRHRRLATEAAGQRDRVDPADPTRPSRNPRNSVIAPDKANAGANNVLRLMVGKNVRLSRERAGLSQRGLCSGGSRVARLSTATRLGRTADHQLMAKAA